MEWVGRFNQAMEYIEEHITEETDYEALGRIVCCSAYQFQRMFAFMSDIFYYNDIKYNHNCLPCVKQNQ